MSVLGAAAATACALVLGAAALGHLRDRAGTRGAILAHGVLPPAVAGPAALALPVVEGVLALGLLWALLTGATGRVAAGGALLLLAGFTAYLLIALRRTTTTAASLNPRDVPCGCGLGRAPLSVWAVARSGVLAALAGMALLAGLPGWAGVRGQGGQVAGLDPAVPVWAQFVVILAAGLTLAIATALLPSARAVPASMQVLSGGVR